MLVFIAPDRDRGIELERAVRQFLTWQSIQAEQDQLNLDTFQRNRVASGFKRADDTVAARIKETYSWLLVPAQDVTPGQPPGELHFEVSRIPGNGSHVEAASKRVVHEEKLITRWSPTLLRMELDRWLWKDSPDIGIKKLWEYLCTYCYLPRLKNVDVLLEAINGGVSRFDHNDFFSYAEAQDDATGRYRGLCLGDGAGSVQLNASSLLVKPEVAAKQLGADRMATTSPRNSGAIGSAAPLFVPGSPSRR